VQARRGDGPPLPCPLPVRQGRRHEVQRADAHEARRPALRSEGIGLEEREHVAGLATSQERDLDLTHKGSGRVEGRGRLMRRSVEMPDVERLYLLT
jgi:hypothetical protein